MAIDFKNINEQLLRRFRDFLPEWLPGGELAGREWKVGSLRGGMGSSMSVNIETGVWKDFATGEGGADPVSLYAAINGYTQGQAAKELQSMIGTTYEPTNSNGHAKPEERLSPPPVGMPPPSMFHDKHGAPSMAWCYRSPEGQPLFYQARYETENGKEFIPWSWSSLHRKWIKRAWPKPRPLFGLDDLTDRPSAPVLIVEGERTAESAKELLGKHYVVVTWQGGANAWSSADWNPVTGRKILLWPDADNSQIARSKTQAQKAGVQEGDILPYHHQPGPAAMFGIAQTLIRDCPEIKIINVSDRPDKWDASDAIDEGWDTKRVIEWAKEPGRTSVIGKQIIEAPPEPKKPPVEKPRKEPKPKPPAVNVAIHDDLGIVSGSVQALWDECRVAVSSNGQPMMNMANIVRILSRVPQFNNIVQYDEFHNDLFTNFVWADGSQGPRRIWGDSDMLAMLHFLQDKCGFTKINQQSVEQAIVYWANQHVVNEPVEWVESLTWDGTNRIEEFFIRAYGSEDTQYHRDVSRNWWIGMLARLMVPGSKVDNIVTLEGNQGIKKSSVLRVLGGAAVSGGQDHWYGVITDNPTNKDFVLKLQGKLILEIAELDAFGSASFKTIKRIISQQVDQIRVPYESKPRPFPRMCIWVGTTNEDAYLDDPTGGRRFWPVKVTAIDIDYVKENREQLFAEALARFKRGEEWWIDPHDAKEQQQLRQQRDPLEVDITHYVDAIGGSQGVLIKKDYVTAHQVMEHLNFDATKKTRNLEMRIAAVFRAKGWSKRRLTIDGMRDYYYIRPGVLVYDSVVVSSEPKKEVVNYAPKG